jgi:hypothetical protein
MSFGRTKLVINPRISNPGHGKIHYVHPRLPRLSTAHGNHVSWNPSSRTVQAESRALFSDVPPNAKLKRQGKVEKEKQQHLKL